jgi:hypothetical protein
MAAMNPRFAVLLFCAALASAACARATTVFPGTRATTDFPGSCGDDTVKFDVKTEKSQLPAAPPVAGKAQIVFIEKGGSLKSELIRYAIDGAWVGANKGDSYFRVTVEPGIHRICSELQAKDGRSGGSIQLAMLSVKPGKIYYIETATGESGVGGGYFPPTTGPGLTGSGGGAIYSGGLNSFCTLTQLDEVTGEHRVRHWKLSTWNTNK